VSVDLLYSFYAGYDALTLTGSNLSDVFNIAATHFGLKQIKIAFNWKSIETAHGTFNWTTMDTVAGYIQQQGLKTIAFFPQSATPNWAMKGTPAAGVNVSACKPGTTNVAPSDKTYYSDFIFAALSRYHDSMAIQYVELQNEPNAICLWPDTAAWLAEVDNEVYSKNKAAFPNIKICSASMHQPLKLGTNDVAAENSYTDSFLTTYLTNLTQIDCFSIHDYAQLGQTQTQSDSAMKYSSSLDLDDVLQTLLTATGKGSVPLMHTECGYPRTAIFSGDEDLSAADMVQAYILKHAKGISQGRLCQAISSGTVGQAGGEDYGLVDITQSIVYAGYYAFKTMRAIMLKYPTHVARIAGTPNSTAYWIEKFQNAAGASVYVAFVPIQYNLYSSQTPSAPASQSATIQIGVGKSATQTTMKGVASVLPADGSGNVTVTLTGEPVYLEVQ